MMNGLQAKFASNCIIDDGSDGKLRTAKPMADELKGISAGTGLAMMLRANGLVLRPEKLRGEPVVYRVEAGWLGCCERDRQPSVAQERPSVRLETRRQN